MPALANKQHEAFAQALAKGQSTFDAYRIAGYTGVQSNSSRLAKHPDILERLAELREKKAQRLIAKDEFEPVELFRSLVRDIEDAKAAGEFKAAIDGRKFLIQCFGFIDSPTLTHEMVRGQSLNQGQVAEITEERAREAVAEMGGNMVKAFRAIAAARDAGALAVPKDITPEASGGR